MLYSHRLARCAGPLTLPTTLIMCWVWQGFAAGYVGEYLKDTSTADKFNVGEYWVDLQCVTHPCMRPLRPNHPQARMLEVSTTCAVLVMHVRICICVNVRL